MPQTVKLSLEEWWALHNFVVEYARQIANYDNTDPEYVALIAVIDAVEQRIADELADDEVAPDVVVKQAEK